MNKKVLHTMYVQLRSFQTAGSAAFVSCICVHVRIHLYV